ncbi:MAG: ABC transporter ATP-binding protein [Pseudomonadales bacterium]
MTTNGSAGTPGVPPLIRARGLQKTYGDVQALTGFDLDLPPGRILGLMGPNGAGKTTAIKTLLGLTRREAGELAVLGLDPFTHRAAVMRHTAYIADTGILPGWMTVRDLVDCFAGLHPSFDRARLDRALAGTDVRRASRVRTLSKGMHVQLHLALIMAIDARLLVLDEPTLGLDQIYRQRFYEMLIGDFAGESRSILITTHEVREIEHLLTDVVFLDHGRKVLEIGTADIERRYAKVAVKPDCLDAARALNPLKAFTTLHGVELVFDGVDRSALSRFGVVTTPNLAELFVAVVEAGQGPGTQRAPGP